MSRNHPDYYFSADGLELFPHPPPPGVPCHPVDARSAAWAEQRLELARRKLGPEQLAAIAPRLKAIRKAYSGPPGALKAALAARQKLPPPQLFFPDADQQDEDESRAIAAAEDAWFDPPDFEGYYRVRAEEKSRAEAARAATATDSRSEPGAKKKNGGGNNGGFFSATG